MKVIIRLYQGLLHAKRGLLYSVFGYHAVCKHVPSCSEYMLRAIKKDGTIAGLTKGLRRILLCW